MNIGQAATASGVTPKMIRYYEQIGVLPAAPRSAAGYRRYGATAVRTLAFIRRARDLGFSVETTRDLLALWQDRARSSAEVKRIARHHIDALNAKARALTEMADALQHLADHCHGDARPECPILQALDQSGHVPVHSVTKSENDGRLAGPSGVETVPMARKPRNL